jgi:hypothetical protein
MMGGSCGTLALQNNTANSTCMNVIFFPDIEIFLSSGLWHE